VSEDELISIAKEDVHCKWVDLLNTIAKWKGRGNIAGASVTWSIGLHLATKRRHRRETDGHEITPRMGTMRKRPSASRGSLWW